MPAVFVSILRNKFPARWRRPGLTMPRMMLPHRASTRIALTAVVIVVLAWLPLRALHDLDSYDNATLDRDLEMELDDIYKLLQPDAETAISTIKEDLIQVLDDDDD